MQLLDAITRRGSYLNVGLLALLGLAVGLLGVAITILCFVLSERSSTRRNRELPGKVHNLLAHGADYAKYVKALAGKMTSRGTVSAKLIRKDGTTVDLGELPPPQ
jgi:hypothetical protein